MLRVAAATFVLSMAAVAQDQPEMPKPVKEHEWLQQYVGEWESEAEIVMEPGKEPMKSKGTETVRAIGGFWIQCENKGSMMGKGFTGVATIGYDPDKKSTSARGSTRWGA